MSIDKENLGKKLGKENSLKENSLKKLGRYDAIGSRTTTTSRTSLWTSINAYFAK